MEIESAMFCTCMKAPTVLRIYDSGRKEIRFYVEPHLNEALVKHDVRIRKVPNKDDLEKYDAVVYCPVCGKSLSEVYSGIPLDWECLASPHALVTIPINQIPKSWIVHKGDTTQ